MAEFLGQIEGGCSESTPFTGLGSCDRSEGRTANLLITGINASYPIDPELFRTNIHDYILSDGVDGITPISDVTGTTLNGGEFNVVTSGYGEESVQNLSVQRDVYTLKGGDCRYKELAKLNKREVRVMRVDDEQYLNNTAFKLVEEIRMRGFRAQLYVRKVRPTGDGQFLIEISVAYSLQYENEGKNHNTFYLGDSPDGLLGIALKPGAAGTASVVLTCSGDDVTADYGEDWAPEMFVQADGTPATTVTYDEATRLLTIAPAGSYRIASAKVLDAGNIVGYGGANVYATIAG